MRQLGTILDFDVLTLGGWWRIVLDERQEQFVQFGCRNLALLVLIDMQGRFHDFEYSLFGHGRGKDDREVGERCESVAYAGFELLDVCRGLTLDEIPFVHAYDEAFLVFLDD